MPGYIAGASLVFVKVFDDLATPLLLNVKDMLAPQAYLRVTSIGIADPMGYVICRGADRRLGRGHVALGAGHARDATTRPCSAAAAAWRSAAAAAGESVARLCVVVLILLLVLAPHLGLLLLSFATVWSFSPLPDAYTIAHYARVFGESSHLHQEHADLRHARRPDRRRARRRPSPISCCGRG